MKKNFKQNNKLELPEIYQLKKIISEYKILVGKLQSEIDDLVYKNGILLSKGKELENKLNNSTPEEHKLLRKEIKSEEMYQTLKKTNRKLTNDNVRMKKEISELVTKLLKYEHSGIS